MIFVHALRNALIPIITLFGLSLPGLLGGSYIVESIFNWPGLGTLGIKAITAREYSELMALNLITAVLVLLVRVRVRVQPTQQRPRCAR